LVSTMDIINWSILGAGILFGFLALLGMILYNRRIFKLDVIRTFTEVFLVIALNFTVIGNLYISPFLPILRLDIPTLMARGALKACPMAIILRVFTDTWAMVYIVSTLAIIVVVGLVLGRSLCAWACPIGFFQDLLNKVRNLFKINPIEPSQKMHNRAKSLRFAVLFFFLLLSLSIGIAAVWDLTAGGIYRSYLPVGTSQTAPFCAICPTPTLYYVLTVFQGTGFHWEDPLHYIMWPILIGIVMGALMMPRFFCRYLCPVGAIPSLFNKITFIQKTNDHEKITQFKVCYTKCPMRGEIVQDEDIKTRISDTNCTYCGECVERCYERALSIKMGPVTIYKGGKSWAETQEESL
jgi:ferredoxin-type protein NapH